MHEARTERIARWRWFVLFAIGISYLLVFTQRTGPGVISDQLQAECHITAAVLGTITSIQYLLYMLMQIPVGIYGDRAGPERMLVAGVLLDGAGTLVFATAHQFWWLLLGRAIVGFGDSLIWVNIVLILGKWFAKGRFAAILGVVNTAGNLGALVTSIPLAAWIAVQGWHIPFLVVGILLVAAALVDLVALTTGPARFAGASDGLSTLQVEHVGLRRMLAEVLRDRLSWATFCCHFGAMGTYLAMVSLWIVPYFIGVYGLARAHAAWFTLIAFIGALVASPVMGWVSDRLNERRRPYLVMQILTTLAWLAIVLWRGQPPLVAAGAIMAIVGMGCGSSLLTFAAIRDTVPVERSGITSGFANTGGFLSAVLLPVLFGAVIDAAGGTAGVSADASRHAYGLAFILPAAFSAVGVLGSLMLPKGRTA